MGSVRAALSFVESGFSLFQFAFQFGKPERVRKITRSQHPHSLFSRHTVKLLQSEVLGGCAGIAGVDVEISDESSLIHRYVNSHSNALNTHSLQPHLI